MLKNPAALPRLRALTFAVILMAGIYPQLTNAQVPAGNIRVHYNRPDKAYSGWTVYAFGDTTEPTNDFNSGPVGVTGTDAFGVYFDVGVKPNAQSVGLIIHNGGNKDPGPNEFVDPSTQGNEFWALSGFATLYTTQPNVAQPGTLLPSYARVHYYRPDRNYSNWFVYSFVDTLEPNDFNDGPVPVTGTDSYGAYFDIQLKPNPQDLGFIIHNTSTGTKDPGPDMHLNVAQFKEAWVISGDTTLYTSQPSPAQILSSGFSRLQAFWINRTTIAIQSQYFQSGWTYSLAYSPTASLSINSNATLSGGAFIALEPASGLTPAEAQQYPQLAGYAVFHLSSDVQPSALAAALKSQVALAGSDNTGALKYITGVQAAGVLDDLFYYSGALGPMFKSGQMTVSVWAPTAQSVDLLLYNGAMDAAPAATTAMTETNGTWSATVDSRWATRYYLFSVSVYVPSLHQIVKNTVTDPYSVDIALNGSKSRLTDLTARWTKPDNWDTSKSPPLRSKSDFSIYELHVRDFSTADLSVPSQHRGTYLAFADPGSNGMRHLHELAHAGLKAIHLLPTFHFASINEDKSTWQTPGDLSGYPPDSSAQQAAVAKVQSVDDYNWGYDPVHYMAPEGAYALNPDDRVREYREMVMGLHHAGLRVVQDVVFNHTSSNGQAPNSVLDEIVPNYYYRLNADGDVENGSCCSDTASEHRMMEKLMIDAVVQNAREYKIDGFRFDLMSFHFVYNMQHIQSALSKLTVENDGVDGSKIYLYGEGWNFGETGNNALGPNADQINMYGTGVGTFNDRIRDGIRGGGPFSDQRVQGFATGLFTDPSLYTSQNETLPNQQTDLLNEADWIRAGLAGNLRDYKFENSSGQVTKASQIIYGGQPVGYTAAPIEVINYCSVHDNQTLFDAIQLKSAIPGTTSSAGDTIEMRARRQALAMSLIAFGQGIPFFLAGDDLLRSKDMDNNSYDSGDWFNKIDFTYQFANWGVGLPIASQNESNWSYMQPLLADSALAPTHKNIDYARNAFTEYLAIRESSLLFRMATLEEVQNNLQFLNTGVNQMPGLIVMKLDANGTDYGAYRHVVVVFNATLSTVDFQDDSLKSLGFYLHPVQFNSADPTVRTSRVNDQTGSTHVLALTTAVFVSDRP